MSVANPAFRVLRRSVVGEEGEWVKMFDPPNESPPTPDLLAPTNPVPEVMAAAGFQRAPTIPHTVQRNLLLGLTIPTWDGLKNLRFFVIGDRDNPTAAGGNYPAATIRIPRGAVFHSETVGAGPPPHTIHWHGIEPTPQNDGVGHCSMEIGRYIYQLQPNFIGTYFYHCHRNTVQHFEFGLFGLFIVDPPDVYFATQNFGVPIGNGNPEPGFPNGRRRTAANTAAFSQFPGFVGGDPTFGVGNATDDGVGDPHAFTVPYDVEAFWVFDDRDSRWSDLAPGAFATFPRHGNQPGVNDQFHLNTGAQGFFAFNDFHPDYFFVTGVQVPAPAGSTGTIPPSVIVPPELNSGVSGTQVSINAQVGQTILVRCLDAAYAKTRITFPLDVVIIAWDGRALGVPPFTRYNHAFLLPANTPITISTARRFDALIRPTAPNNNPAIVEFMNTRGDNIVITAQIPINITASTGVFEISGTVTDRGRAPLPGVTMTLGGAAIQTVVTDGAGNYRFTGLGDGSFTVTPSLAGFRFISASRNVTISGASVTRRNFIGIRRPV